MSSLLSNYVSEKNIRNEELQPEYRFWKVLSIVTSFLKAEVTSHMFIPFRKEQKPQITDLRHLSSKYINQNYVSFLINYEKHGNEVTWIIDYNCMVTVL